MSRIESSRDTWDIELCNFADNSQTLKFKKNEYSKKYLNLYPNIIILEKLLTFFN